MQYRRFILMNQNAWVGWILGTVIPNNAVQADANCYRFGVLLVYALDHCSQIMYICGDIIQRFQHVGPRHHVVAPLVVVPPRRSGAGRTAPFRHCTCPAHRSAVIMSSISARSVLTTSLSGTCVLAWRFGITHMGGKTHTSAYKYAVLFTIRETCRICGINPHDFLICHMRNEIDDIPKVAVVPACCMAAPERLHPPIS